MSAASVSGLFVIFAAVATFETKAASGRSGATAGTGPFPKPLVPIGFLGLVPFGRDDRPAECIGGFGATPFGAKFA